MMDLPNILLWNWSPGMIAAVLLLLAGYGWMNRFNGIRKLLLFTGGMLLTALALALPMGPAPHQQLFSLHMIRHIILLMLAPPLMVAGMPAAPVRKFFSKSGVQQWAAILLNPLVTWILGIGIMWFWHAPVIYNSMVMYSGSGMSSYLHITEMLSLMGIGMLFCSPVLFPLKKYRLPDLKGIVYLFTACWGCSLLGILITFAPSGLYHTVFSGGSAAVWGLSRQIDQQLGGLLMWVPGCIIYLTGIIVLLIRWYSSAKSISQSTRKKTAAA